MHHIGHLDSLCHDHGHQILRRSDDNNTINRQALEHSQRHVTGSGRHIHEHIIHIFPNHIGPELLDSTGNDGTAPNHRRSRIVQQQIDGHDLNAAAGQCRIQALLIGTLTLRDTESGRCRRTGDVSIQNANLVALAGHGYSQHGSNGGLANTALAGYDCDYFLDSRIGIEACQQAFCLAICAIRATAGAIAITRTHLNLAPLFIFFHIIELQTGSVNLHLKSGRYGRENRPAPDVFSRRSPTVLL